jgi:hypothetical protein
MDAWQDTTARSRPAGGGKATSQTRFERVPRADSGRLLAERSISEPAGVPMSRVPHQPDDAKQANLGLRVEVNFSAGRQNEPRPIAAGVMPKFSTIAWRRGLAW